MMAWGEIKLTWKIARRVAVLLTKFVVGTTSAVVVLRVFYLVIRLSIRTTICGAKESKYRMVIGGTKSGDKTSTFGARLGRVRAKSPGKPVSPVLTWSLKNVRKTLVAAGAEIPTCDTVFGYALPAMLAEGYSSPSDFLDEQRRKHGSVFYIPLGPKAVTPVFVLDIAAAKKLSIKAGFERTNIAEDALSCSLKLPPVSKPMKQAETNEILYKVVRALATKHAQDIRTRLFKNVSDAMEASFGSAVEHTDLFQVAARAALISLGGGLLNTELASDQKFHAGVREYAYNFPKIFMLSKLGLPGAELLRKPLYGLVDLVNSMRKRFNTEEEFLAQFCPFTRDIREATLGKLGKRFGIESEMAKTAYSFVLPIIAAVLNTTPSFYWLLLGVLRDPDARRAVYEEVRSQIPDGDVSPYLAKLAIAEDGNPAHWLPKFFPKLNSCMMEAMRMSTAVVAMYRASRDTCLNWTDSSTGEPCGPFKVKRDQLLVVPILNLHYNEDVFENPSHFVWDRFLPDEKTGRQKVYSASDGTKVPLLNFGIGNSVCPGRRIALDTILAMAISVFAVYDIEIDPSTPHPNLSMNEWSIGALTPTCAVPVHITKHIDKAQSSIKLVN